MTNKGLEIRPVHPDDVADLYEMITDRRVLNTLVHAPTMEYQEEEEWVRNSKRGAHRLVAELDGKVVASGALGHNQRPRMTHSGGLGLLVHADYWGQGIGNAVMAALLDLADNWLNLARVELEVFTDNPAAIHLYEKFGFEIEGTKRLAIFGGDGRFHDEHVMARIREAGLIHKERRNDPPPAPPSQASGPVTITIRPQHPDDNDALHAIRRRPLVARTTLQRPSLELTEVTERMKERPPGGHRLVAEINGRVVGSGALFIHQNPRTAHCAGLGMMVDPGYWGLGVGTRLMAEMMDLADNWLNLKRVWLEVNTDNPAGVHLYEKFGFEIEGTKRFHTFGDGRWADSYFMARIRP